MKTSLLTTTFGFLIATAKFVQANLAVDTFILQSDASFKCAYSNGYDSAAIGCYEEGEPLVDCITNFFNARTIGTMDVDLSLRPCAHGNCKSPGAQVTELTTFANTHNMDYRYLWLHVEHDENWLSLDDNRKALSAFKAALDAASQTTSWKWGIKTSISDWDRITGSADWVLDGGVPLWDTFHYDGKRDFNYFIPYGGWTKPFSKQYAENSNICDATFGESYYEPRTPLDASH